MKQIKTLIGGLALLTLALATPIALADVPGTIETIVGNYDPDGAPGTTIPMDLSLSVTTDSTGNVYFTDLSHVYRMDTSGRAFLVAGNGLKGYGGDGGEAKSAAVNFASRVSFDGAGNLVFADTRNQRIRNRPRDGNHHHDRGKRPRGVQRRRGPCDERPAVPS